MFKTASTLSEQARQRLVESLNARLADGVDLYTQLKVAHWNVKGPHFAALHPLFDSFASALAGFNDEIAERSLALGGSAPVTARVAARQSRIAELPEGTRQGLELVRLLAERFAAYLVGVRETRELGEDLGDAETADLLTEVGAELEKHAWFLNATLES